MSPIHLAASSPSAPMLVLVLIPIVLVLAMSLPMAVWAYRQRDDSTWSDPAEWSVSTGSGAHVVVRVSGEVLSIIPQHGTSCEGIEPGEYVLSTYSTGV